MALYKYKKNLLKRIIGTIIAYSIISVFSYLYILIFGHPNEVGEQVVTGFSAFPVIIVWFIYFVIIELMYGGTLSHQALNLKVVTSKRKDINFGNALKRHLLDPIDILVFFGLPALIFINTTEKHQRLSDLWADTIIVDINDLEQYSEN